MYQVKYLMMMEQAVYLPNVFNVSINNMKGTTEKTQYISIAVIDKQSKPFTWL